MMKCIVALIVMGIVPLSMSCQQAEAQTKGTPGYWHGHPGEPYSGFLRKGFHLLPPFDVVPRPTRSPISRWH